MVLGVSQCKRHRFNSWVRKTPLEKEMVNPLQYFHLGNPWTEEAGGLQSVGSQEFNRTEHAHTHTHTYTHIHKYTCAN